MADTVEKNINININSDIEPTLKNLKELKLALKSAAAGSDDFRKIQTKIDDVQDSLKGAKTSAGNFVDILGTVPGPIGDIGAKASGTIDILKSFGRLKLTDIKKSFMDLGGDLKDAAKGLANLTGLTKVYTKVNEFLAGSFIKVGVAEGTAAVAAKAFSVALVSTGIGAIVVGLGLLIGALMEFVSGEKEATAEIDKFNAAIEASNNAIEDQTATLVREHQKQIADLKATGASEKTIRDKELQQRKEDLVNAQNIEAKKLKDLRAAYLIEDEDNRKAAIEKANDDYRAATKTRKDLDANYYVKAQENRAADLKDSEKATADSLKKAEENKKQYAANLAEKNKIREENAAIQRQIARNEITDERTLKIQELKDTALERAIAADSQIKDKKLLAERIKLIETETNQNLTKIQEEFQKKENEALQKVQSDLKEKDVSEKDKALADTKKFYDDLITKVQAGTQGIENEYGLSYDREAKQFKARVMDRIDGYVEAIDSEEAIAAKKAELDNRRRKENEAIEDAFAKKGLDKSLSNLKKQGEIEFLQAKKNAETARNQILGQEELTKTQREEAEKKFAETIKGLQEKQLQDQINLLEKAGFASEEAKAANNLEILKLQDQLNQSLNKKYEENSDNELTAFNKATNAFLKNNETRLQQIEAVLKTAAATLNAFSDLSDAIEAEELAKIDARYAAQQENQANQLRGFEEVNLAKQQQYEADVLAAQGNQTLLDQIEKNKQKSDYETQDSIRLNKEATADLEYQIALDQDKVRKKNFENQKAFNIANAVITAVQGSISAFTALAVIPVVGPALGIIAAAVALAAGYASVKTISAQQYQPQAIPPPVKGTKGLPPGTQTGGSGSGSGSSGSKFAQGGLLTGRKHSEGGIPTSFGQLEGGEYVVNRSATEAFMPLLDKINGMGQGSGAPNNLSVVGEQTIPAPAPIIKTYVVASDMTNEQEANRRLEQIARL